MHASIAAHQALKDKGILLMNIKDLHVKFVQVHPDAMFPKYQTIGAGAFDVGAYWEGGKAGDSLYIEPHSARLIGTGWKMQAPKGYGLFVLPRSGLAMRGLRPANAPGLIDCDYTGEAKVALRNDTPETQEVKFGERIAQILFAEARQVPLMIVTSLDDTSRGAGGFGSTGHA